MQASGRLAIPDVRRRLFRTGAGTATGGLPGNVAQIKDRGDKGMTINSFSCIHPHTISWHSIKAHIPRSCSCVVLAGSYY